MADLNPIVIIFIAFTAVVGALLGEVLIGLAVGLGVVLISTAFDL